MAFAVFRSQFRRVWLPGMTLMLMGTLLTGCGGGKNMDLFALQNQFEEAGELYAEADACGVGLDQQGIRQRLLEHAQSKGVEGDVLKSLDSSYLTAIELKRAALVRHTCSAEEKERIAAALVKIVPAPPAP